MVDLDDNTVLLAALVILLVPFPLISIGTTEGIALLWWLGLALLVLGGVVPPVMRYVGEDDEGGEDGEPDDGTVGAGDENGGRENSPDVGGTDGASTGTDARSRSRRGGRRGSSGDTTVRGRAPGTHPSRPNKPARKHSGPSAL